jgi:hypothetical protein
VAAINTTRLDDAVEALQTLVERISELAQRSVWAAVNAALMALPQGDWNEDTKRALIAELRQVLPDVVSGHVGLAADQTAQWYTDLAPDEDFTAIVPPDDVVTAERIVTSISWAVNTATTIETAISQLQGSVQRAVLDGQRATVSHNAAREGIRYRRHCGYAACNWCLVLAGRGAIYTSAANAVRGHDNCRCLAVPERADMAAYTVPPLVRDAEAKYAAARKQIEAEGATPTLDTVVRRMGSIGATPDR